MGKKSGGGASMPSPSEYIPLVNAQAQANRVNTYTPYGSTVFQPVGGAQQPQGGDSGGGKSSGGSKSSRIQGLEGQQQGGSGITPMESVTTLSPEIQGLFDQQIGMAGSRVGNKNVRNRQMQMALNPESFDQQIEQATFQRAMNLLEPGFEQQTRGFQQSMADRGLPVGGEAFDDEFANIQRAQNSARENAALSAVLAGNDAALRARGQNFGELGSLINQDFAQRGQQFNELASILGQNQVTPIAPVDVMGPANMAMNQNMANMQADAGKKSSLTNAGTGLGAMYLMGSDRRMKDNIVKVGEYLPGMNIYEFTYKGQDEKRIGFMSDEVKKFYPEAVFKRDDGYEMVNYGMILNGYLH